MSNVSSSQIVPMNTGYSQLDQFAVRANTPSELSVSIDSTNKLLKDSTLAPKENNITVNKESLEKLFAMFEFAVKAMRSMLAGMGVLPKLPGDLGVQLEVKPGPEAKVAPDAGVQPKVTPKVKAQVKPDLDGKVAVDAGVQPKVTPEAEVKTQVKPGLDGKVAVDARVQPKVTLEAEVRVPVKPGSEVKVMQDKPIQLTISPDGKLVSRPSTTNLNDVAQQNKLSNDINVTVQIQNCHCPHTDGKVAPQPGLTPKVDTPALPTPGLTPRVDTPALPTPGVTPKVHTPPSPRQPVETEVPTPPKEDPKPDTPPIPDVTSPAPDDLDDDFGGQSHTRFDNHLTARSGLRRRF